MHALNRMERIDPEDLVRIEAAAVEDSFSLATAAEREALGLYCEWHGDTLVTACRAEPDILMNRTFGFSPADIDKLPGMLDVYRRMGSKRAFISMDEEAFTQAQDPLQRAGLTAARPWVKFMRDDSPAPAATTDLAVREIGTEHGEALGNVICNAFDLPKGWAPILGRLAGREHWHAFATFDGEMLAGGGLVYVRDGIAWIGFGATDPAFRQRGSQSAVMSARIERARELGVKVMQTETGEAVPGDPQHSYHNIERAGFRPHHRIMNMAFRP